MPQASLAELYALADSTGKFLSTEFPKHLETGHIKNISKKLQHKSVSTTLMPAIAFEAEIKHKLANAGQELARAASRIGSIAGLRSGLHARYSLRFARNNLAEAGKDMDAARAAHKGLAIYQKRSGNASAILGNELSKETVALLDKIELLEKFQKPLHEKTALLINDFLAKSK